MIIGLLDASVLQIESAYLPSSPFDVGLHFVSSLREPPPIKSNFLIGRVDLNKLQLGLHVSVSINKHGRKLAD